ELISILIIITTTISRYLSGKMESNIEQTIFIQICCCGRRNQAEYHRFQSKTAGISYPLLKLTLECATAASLLTSPEMSSTSWGCNRVT
ncbi:MAG: hypothetical protein WBL92_02255, partial [Methanothrix sp.]